MHIERLDLNLFVVLQAVYAEGSITKASQRLNVTQPAVSHALRRLRESLGDPLFVRHGNAITPTSFTRNLMGPVVKALTDLQAAVSDATHFDPTSMPRRFTIGIRDSLEITVVPVLIDRLMALSPQSQVNCIAIDRKRLVDELATGTLDCAVGLPMNLDESISRVRLATDRMIVLARPDHPAIRNRRLSLGAYLKQSHVAVTLRRTGETLEDTALNHAGHQRKVCLSVQRYWVAVNVVAQSDLLLTMPAQYAQIVNAAAMTVQFEAPFAIPTVEYYLYWHKNMQADPASQWIREQIIDAFKPK